MKLIPNIRDGVLQGLTLCSETPAEEGFVLLCMQSNKILHAKAMQRGSPMTGMCQPPEIDIKIAPNDEATALMRLTPWTAICKVLRERFPDAYAAVEDELSRHEQPPAS